MASRKLTVVERAALDISTCLGVDLSISHAPCYGGYRLEANGGSTGFAYNNGTEPRMQRKEFLLYLQGIRDCLDHFELTGGAA